MGYKGYPIGTKFLDAEGREFVRGAGGGGQDQVELIFPLGAKPGQSFLYCTIRNGGGGGRNTRHIDRPPEYEGYAERQTIREPRLSVFGRLTRWIRTVL